LKSVFGQPKEESSVVQQDQVLLNPPGQVVLDNSPQPGVERPLDTRPLDVQLHDALDRSALSFLRILEDDDTKPEGASRYDIGFRMKIFAQAQEWLAKRSKLKPADETQDDAGVDLLREMVQDPESVVDRLQDNPKFIAALEQRGWIKEPPKRNGPGRPPRGDSERAARFREIKRAKQAEDGKTDDSQLAALLAAAKKGTN
jgi:hypothetical protein